MAAINLALTSIFIKNKWQHINIIYSDELYCDTPRLLKHMVKIYGTIDTYLIDITDTSHIKSIFKELQGQTNILLIVAFSEYQDWENIFFPRCKRIVLDPQYEFNTPILFDSVINLLAQSNDSLLSILFDELHKDSPDGSL